MKKIKHIRTVSGITIDPLNPLPQDFNIFDIAAGLSKVCRYSGQLKQFISVAEHSVLVSTLVPKHLALHALLHDAAEAYLGDVPSPVKHLCADFSVIEAKFDYAIQRALTNFRLTREEQAELKHADVCSTVPELEGWMLGLNPDDAYKSFLQRYEVLTREERSNQA